LHRAAELKEVSQPGESEGDFRVRLAHKLNEQRDAAMDDLRARYAQKQAAFQEKVRKARQKLEKEKSQASHETWQAIVSFGTSLLKAICGRKLNSATNLGRAETSMRSAGRAWKEREEVGQAEENVEALQKQMADLDAQCQEEIEQVRKDAQPENQQFETVQVQPKKADISVTQVVLCWTPWDESADGVLTRAW
jgi:F0F1-type ATP synthase membrane subunit b/b'